MTCKKVKANYDPSQLIVLPLPDDDRQVIQLSDCFKEYAEKEKLDGNEQVYCSFCKEWQDTEKQLQIWKTPKIMLIQLKRFDKRKTPEYMYPGYAMYNQNHFGGVQFEKKRTFVDYPIEGLDMRQYVQSIRGEAEPVLYDLYAVSNHIGGMNGGHYTATCKNPIDGTWNYFNDANVDSCMLSDNVKIGLNTWKEYRAIGAMNDDYKEKRWFEMMTMRNRRKMEECRKA